MHNISARNNHNHSVSKQRSYRRDTLKPRKTYMKKRAKLESLARNFSLLSLTH